MVNFKTRKHFKDKKSHYVGEDQWTVFEDTQEPIIDQETFDNVQRIRSNVRRYPVYLFCLFKSSGWNTLPDTAQDQRRCGHGAD